MIAQGGSGAPDEREPALFHEMTAPDGRENSNIFVHEMLRKQFQKQLSALDAGAARLKRGKEAKGHVFWPMTSLIQPQAGL